VKLSYVLNVNPVWPRVVDLLRELLGKQAMGKFYARSGSTIAIYGGCAHDARGDQADAVAPATSRTQMLKPK
jgi:hypothetical protein